MSLKSKLRTLLKIDPRIMRKLRKVVAPFRRIGLKKQFTIFSDNCWGGRLYDKFALQYLSPTIGLAIEESDYIKFLLNLDYYISLTPKPIINNQKKVNDEWGYYDCLLGDIKIQFRHYRDVNDAINKWERRKHRIFKDNIIVKMSYYDNQPDVLNAFISLPYKKILFTSDEKLVKNNNDLLKIIYIPKESIDAEFVTSDSKLKLKDIKSLINL